jgi:large subunit ribosomal protein L16
MQQPPKNRRFRKDRKGRNYGNSTASEVQFGEIGLKAIERGRLDPRQIEAGRRAIAGSTKREGKVIIRVYPDKPVSKKPLEVRQGKGKGNVEVYVYSVKPGAIIYELHGVSEELAVVALEKASAKMPVACKIVKRDNSGIGDRSEG